MPATASEALDALGDAHRRRIVELLQAEPLQVRAIADQLPISRPAVSRHLRLLKEAGLVRDAAEGTRRIYRLDPTGLATLRTYLDSMWQNSLRRFADAVDDRAEQPSQRARP